MMRHSLFVPAPILGDPMPFRFGKWLRASPPGPLENFPSSCTRSRGSPMGQSGGGLPGCSRKDTPFAPAQTLGPFGLYAPSGAPRGQTATPFALYRAPRAAHTQGAPEGVPEGVRADRAPSRCPSGKAPVRTGCTGVVRGRDGVAGGASLLRPYDSCVVE